MTDEKSVKKTVVVDVELPEGPATQLMESAGLTGPVFIPIRWLAFQLRMTPAELIEMIAGREAEDSDRHG